jgi:hypothetical protein
LTWARPVLIDLLEESQINTFVHTDMLLGLNVSTGDRRRRRTARRPE